DLVYTIVDDGVPPIARPLDIDSTPLTSVSTDSFSDSDHGTTEARQTALHLAMQVLGPDYVLDDATHLVHREAEWCTLEWFAATCEQPQRQAVFLVGPRGTGKSTMAHLLTHALQATWASKRVVQLDASEVGDASSLYMAIAARVTSSPDHASVSHAIAALKIAFTERTSPTTVLVLDNIDMLLHGRHLHRFVEWAHHPSSSLVFVGVAHSIVETRQYLDTWTHKTYYPLVVLCAPYTQSALQDIVFARLRQTHCSDPSG
ncbi:hypothetical protein As57867_006963, partial [Aphanomyces stellatus]